MTWNSFGDFVAMGGYGTYVWGSFVVTAVVIAMEIAAVRKRYAAALRVVRKRQAS